MKICAECFNDEEIKKVILGLPSELALCPYYPYPSKLVEINELLDFFSEFLGIFARDSNGKPLIDIIQDDWNLFKDRTVGINILNDIIGLCPTINSNASYKVSYLPEINDCILHWQTLKDELKWKSRYLTDSKSLSEDYGWDILFDVYSEITSDISLYRARINKNGDSNCFPIDQMGCPPQEFATNGRANPSGIPYLYLSKELETTLYETRATFLDMLSIGTFKLKEEINLNLVDFTKNESPINFDNMILRTKGRLLRKAISLDLSKPMRRFDSELEYIPTQFICEYIRYNTGTEGIQFKSSLYKEGTNIVLFDSSKIDCIDVQLHKVTTVQIDSEKVIPTVR